MSQARSSSGPTSRVDAGNDPSPKRKVSVDLMRLKNFPSSLSLRKSEPDTSPRSDGLTTSSTFSRLRNFGQSTRQSRSSIGADQADTSADSKSFRRTSRLLDAFKPSKKPTPTFEVVRKPPNRSTASLHSSSQQPSSPVEAHTSVGRLSVHKAPDIDEPAPRISSSASRPQAASSRPQNTSNAVVLPKVNQDDPKARPPYPPSASRNRKYSGNHLSASTERRISDPYLSPASASNSRAQSPSAAPNVDSANGSFNLHSFRNVRSASETSAADDPSTQSHSRVHSMISVDEYATPGEELPEPRFVAEADTSRGQSASPIPHAKPASISAAKFRQAARQRSESGTIPTLDTLQGGSGLVRPSRSRTPSQDLAAMEAVLAQTHPNAYRTSDAEKRRTADPAVLSAAISSMSISDDSQRRKRGFFIVVEGLDRAGKSTQVERLAEHLQAKAIKFPERTTAIGQMINSYLAQTNDLDDQAIHLLFSANRWECVSSIKKTLEAGESIVCDRYAFSGIAYSVAKGLSYDWCRSPDVGLPLPDLTMFLDLDAQTAAARGGYGEERYEKLDFQAKVRDAFSRVSQDVKGHGGRWVTIDASKTLDQVTDDIQKAVQRVTSSIDRVGAKPGKLFVSERPANVRAGSSNELYSTLAIPGIKRSSLSSEDLTRSGKSLDQPRINVSTATSNGNFPISRPSGSPLSYTDQLAAVRAAAAGTLSGLFGGSNVTIDQQSQRSPSVNGEKQFPDLDGPSPTNATRGQGYDSARVLANLREGSGRRRTLIDVIGEIESQPQQATWADHRRSLSAAPETASPTTEGLPNIFAQAGRARRSTEQGRVSVLPTIESNGARPAVAPRGASLTIQPSAVDATAHGAAVPTYPTSGDRPVASPSSPRDPSHYSNGSASGALSASAVRPPTLSPATRTSSSALSTSSRSSFTSPPPRALSTPPILRPASTQPAGLIHSDAAAGNIDPNPLSSQHLTMLAMHQNQAELQEQYMRNHMAMMANPMLAQQAHYQMMLQRHQQQYYGRAASAIGPSFGSNLGAGANGNGVQPSPGGPPLAAFMQPASSPGLPPDANSKEGRRSVDGQRQRAHKRTPSSGELFTNFQTGTANGETSTSTSQPMLSMMMAAPPTNSINSSAAAAMSAAGFAPQTYYATAQKMNAQPMFYHNGAQALPQMMSGMAWPQQAGMTAAAYGGARPAFGATRSDVGTPALKTQRSSDAALQAQYLKHQQQK